MDTFTDCRCLVCYHKGEIATFVSKSKIELYELECPECLNNDCDYIENIHTQEMIAVSNGAEA